MAKNKLVDSASGFLKGLKENWNKPKPGEYLTVKEIASYGAGQVGSFVYATIAGLMVFGANYYCGSIMGISNLDFYKVGLIGTILNYLLMFLNPFNVLIYENHGRLQPKVRNLAILAFSGQMIIGIMCYFLPIEMFETVPKVGMIAFPQILGNILTVGAFSNIANWIVRRCFSAKYGRIKPFIILYGIPSAILMSIIPFLPLGTAPYATKLVVLHFAFSFMTYFFNSHNMGGSLVTFMTPNSQERQRLYSIVPIVTSLVPSIIGIFFPMLIDATGGYFELKTYQVFVPIFACLGVAISFFTVNCKERLIENKEITKRDKVTFWKGARKVLSNKYFWITNISNTLGAWSLAYSTILQWWFIYSLRMEWFVGIAANIVVLSMTAGNLLTPFLTKRFQKKNILIFARFGAVLTVLLMFVGISTQSVVIFMFAMFLRNAVGPIENGITSGMNADILDFHQWKHGERADSMSSIFSWFISPISMMLGFILPFLQQGAGFTSDWDILFNSSVLEKVFVINVIFSIVSTILSTIPFLFYDLTKEKHQNCIKELQDRLNDKDNTEQASNLEDIPSLDNAINLEV